MNVILNGFCGQMGQVVYKLSKKDEDINICYGVDNLSLITKLEKNVDVKLTDNIFSIREGDVVLDFSRASAIRGLLNYCVKNQKPLVIATTGHNELEEREILHASQFIPIFKSGNFSLGMQTTLELVKFASSALRDYDIELVETHHNKKLDVPSGSAKMILGEINSSRPNSRVNLGRNNNGLRDKNEVGVHSVRGGGVNGEHTVYFLGQNEIVTISHTALSREVFGEGALKAVKFLKDKKPGLYTMKNLFE